MRKKKKYIWGDKKREEVCKWQSKCVEDRSRGLGEYNKLNESFLWYPFSHYNSVYMQLITFHPNEEIIIIEIWYNQGKERHIAGF